MALHQPMFLLMLSLLQNMRHDCRENVTTEISPEEQQLFPSVPAIILEDILRCPRNSSQMTCSCSTDCHKFGDCCWEVARSASQQNFQQDVDKRWSCEDVPIGNEISLPLFMVSQCDATSSVNDTMRTNCEAQATNDSFYMLPVMGQSNVTYRNAFCAMCNNDIRNASFWYASEVRSANDSSVVVYSAPSFVVSNASHYVRTCSPFKWISSCPPSTLPAISELCRKFLTPVRTEGGVLYKNAYCALCNGVDPVFLSCHLDTTPHIISRTPSLSLDSKPETWNVERRNSCFAWYNDTCYIESDEDGSDDASGAAPEEGWHLQGYLIVISLVLSMICLLLKAVVYGVYKKSRSFSSKCILCLSMTLFLTQLLFLLAMCLDDITAAACKASAVILHYGFLCTFFWTTVLSYDIWESIAIVSTKRSQKFFRYCLVGWGAAFIVIGISSVLNWGGFPFSPHYGFNMYCFIAGRAAYFTFFIGPMTILFLVDVAFYTHIVIIIVKTAKQAKKFDFKGNEKYSRAFLFAKLALIMGIEWLIALLKQFAYSDAIETISSVVIGLQGVYLFFGFKDYKFLVQSCRRRFGKGTIPGQRSTTSTSTLADAHSMSSVRAHEGGHVNTAVVPDT
ncbi:uncharacterized protein LOC135399239 [Ornithodoros turicata]|uniref:uncharacterized protein LOC135399239 n=1 Tax=Ornithodoros turicata TaxID=34597 RepID=UPI003139652D